MARAMKHSGIDWLGNIPADWSVAKVKYCFDIQLGKMLQPEPNDKDDTLEYYLCAANLGGNNLKTDSLKQMWLSPTDKTKFDVRKGDLLVVEGGDVASCDVVTVDVQNLYIQNALHRVRSKNGCDVRFLRYLLIVAKASGHIDLICNKATIAHFTKDKFASMPYLVPPIDEQQRIADFLDKKCARIDSAVDKTRTSIAEYKKLKQSLITRAVTKGIRPGRPMKASGSEWIGDIPANWDVLSFTKSICNIVDYRGKTPEKRDSGTLLVTARNIKDGKIDYDCSREFVRTEDFDEIMHRGKVEIGDVLFTTEAPLGSVANADRTDFALAQRIIKFRGIPNTLDNYYLKFWIMSDSFQQNLATFSTGSTAKGIKASRLGMLKQVLPPLDEQQEIAAYLDGKIALIDSLVAKKTQLITELERLKKSLIFEYVTGKKEVPT